MIFNMSLDHECHAKKMTDYAVSGDMPEWRPRRDATAYCSDPVLWL